MNKALNVILMHDDGRTWRYRVRAFWLKIGFYGILTLLVTSGAGIYGSFFFWQKYIEISNDNIAIQSKVAELQTRIDRLEILKQVLHHKNHPPAWNNASRSAPPRINNVNLELQGSDPNSSLALAPQLNDKLETNASPYEPEQAIPDQEMEAARKDEETVVAALPEKEAAVEVEDTLADADNVQLSVHDGSMELRFDLHNRSSTTIAGQIQVSFIASDEEVVQATGDQRALRFRIQYFREVRSPIHLPTDAKIEDLLAMRLEILNRSGDLLHASTYPLADLLQSKCLNAIQGFLHEG